MSVEHRRRYFSYCGLCQNEGECKLTHSGFLGKLAYKRCDGPIENRRCGECGELLNGPTRPGILNMVCQCFSPTKEIGEPLNGIIEASRCNKRGHRLQALIELIAYVKGRK